MANRRNWRRVLTEAAAILRRDGWVQGEYGDERGRCAVGAIRAVGAPDQAQLSALRHLRQSIPAKFGRSIVSWNDADGRTKGHVIRGLKKAAKS